jgi:YVTN family beta-propeller protein
VNKKTNKIYSASGTSLFSHRRSDQRGQTVTLGTGAYALAVNETTNKYMSPVKTPVASFVIDGAADTIEATVVTGTKGCAVTVNETANEIYVAANMGGKVVVIDGYDNSVKSTVTVGTRPRDIAVNETTHTSMLSMGKRCKQRDGQRYRLRRRLFGPNAGRGKQGVPLRRGSKRNNEYGLCEPGGIRLRAGFNGSDNSMQTVSVAICPQVAVNEKTNKITLPSPAPMRERCGYR